MSNQCSLCGSPCSLLCLCGGAAYCTSTCQRSDWPRHKINCPPYLPDKEGGLEASRSISMGEVVLSEEPLFLAHTDNPKEILAKFGVLAKQNKRTFRNLNSFNKKRTSGSGRDGDQSEQCKVLEIFSQSCLLVGGSSDGGGETRGIFPRFTQIKHSCAGNCLINFSQGSSELKVTAFRRIKKGDKLTVNYLDPYRGRCGASLKFNRQKVLKSSWGLECECQICSFSGQKLAANEKVKGTIEAFDKKLRACNNLSETQNTRICLSLEVEIVGLMRNLDIEMMREMPESLVRCYMFGKVLQVQGVQLNTSPHVYLREARALAFKFGDSFLHKVSLMEYQTDQIVMSVTRSQVELRRRDRRSNLRLLVLYRDEDGEEEKKQ